VTYGQHQTRQDQYPTARFRREAQGSASPLHAMLDLDETAQGNQNQEKDVGGEGEPGPEQVANRHALSYSTLTCCHATIGAREPI
jgi:hypothetical protein